MRRLPLRRPTEPVPENPADQRLQVEILADEKDFVTVKVGFECPFDHGEVTVIFAFNPHARAGHLTCKPERIEASRGRGEATFSVAGKGGITQGLLVRLLDSSEVCGKLSSSAVSLPELERALPDLQPGEYTVGGCAIYRVAEFRKEWPA